MRPDERPMNEVPRAVVVILLLSLALQVILHRYQPAVAAQAQQLPRPPATAVVRALSFSAEIAVAKFAMLWLQSFDNQSGISIPFTGLDYTRVIEWLSLILELDPSAQYPLLAASRIYTEVPDENKQRAMLEFVEREFRQDPNARWPWMAHAVYIAKHRIRDTDLALRYARTLSRDATGPQVPNWAKQMVIFVLEDMGELESAKVLLGGLLDSGKITDSHEQWFLSQRLAELEERLAENAGEE